MGRLVFSHSNSLPQYIDHDTKSSFAWDRSLFIGLDVQHGSTVRASAFSSDGKYLALGSTSYGVVYDLSDYSTVYTNAGWRTELTNAITSVFFTPDNTTLVGNRFVASASIFSVVSTETWSVIYTSPNHEYVLDVSAPYMAVRYQVGGTGDMFVKIRQSASPYTEISTGLVEAAIRAAAISSAYLAVIYFKWGVDTGARIRVYDLVTLQEKTTGLPIEIENPTGTGSWQQVRFSSDGRYLAATWLTDSTYSAHLYVFDTTDWTVAHSLSMGTSTAVTGRICYVADTYDFYVGYQRFFTWTTKILSTIALPLGSTTDGVHTSYTDLVGPFSCTVKDVNGDPAQRSGMLYQLSPLRWLADVTTNVSGETAFTGLTGLTNNVGVLMLDTHPTAQRNDLLFRGLVPDE